MSLGFNERETGKRRESTNGHESALHAALSYSKDRLKMALESHTTLSEDTKKMAAESIDKASLDAFMSDALDSSLAAHNDGKDDEQKATQWLANVIAQDMMPRFAQNNDRYANAKEANALLTFLRGALHKQSM